MDCCKTRDRYTPPPTAAVTHTVPFVSIGTVSFDDLPEDSAVGTYEGLVWTNFVVSTTSPAAPSMPRAAIPSSTTPSFELINGVFSLISIDIAGAPSANPVLVTGFDSNGVQVVQKSISFITTYQTYDFSEFINLSRVEFIFGAANAAGLDNFVFA